MSLAAAALELDLGCTALGAAAALPLAVLASRLSGRTTPRAWMLGGCGAACLAVGISSSATLLGAGLGLALTLTLLAAIDIAALRLPDVITLPLTAAGLVEAILSGQALAPRVLGAALGFAALASLAWGFRRATGRSGLGLGDAKLFAAAGAWLGWDNLPQALLIGCGLAFGWVGVGFVATGRSALERPIPFGAPLCVAILAEWLLTGRGAY